ncbi:response regulator transcription factor [Melioribacteraceae bacterium 4301-Me]|uniref:response regulator transcription factor n=1 Tax=Pyranulibacter aquaticus TaxID=3163344 RepID=UPI003596589C
MEIMLFKILLPIDFIANYLPAVRFRKSEYFIFFAFSCLVDPLMAFLYKYQIIGCFYHIPFYLTLSLIILPGSYRKVRAYAGAGVFFVLFHYLRNREVMQISAAILAICFIIFLINEIRIRNKNEFKAEVFLLLLLMNMFIHYWGIFLYFHHPQLYVSNWWVVVFLDMLTFTLIACAGPERKVSLVFLKIFNEKVNSAAQKHYESEITTNEKKDNHQMAHLAGALAERVDSHNGGEGNDIDGLLTRRELEIYTYLCEGLTNKEISERICRSVKTVESHLIHITEKLGFVSVRELKKFVNDTIRNNSPYFEEGKINKSERN